MNGYKVIHAIFSPRSIKHPTNGTQRTWQVISRVDGKVLALCLSRQAARLIIKALR